MEFVHNRERGCFEAWADAELVGEAFYHLDAEVADFNHTVVPAQFAGRGIASALVGAAMDEVRAAGVWRVRATCPYVAAWFTKHPEYATLLTD